MKFEYHRIDENVVIFVVGKLTRNFFLGTYETECDENAIASLKKPLCKLTDFIEYMKNQLV